MNRRWEGFFGDESHFAIRLALRPEPDPGYVDADLSSSWGGFQIWVEGKNLCAHADQGETLDSVHWYLLPLLEWLASSWDPLLHEERLPIEVGATTAIESLAASCAPSLALPDDVAQEQEDTWFDWWSRHSVRAAREGGPFPDLVLRRWRGEIEFSWGGTPLAGSDGLEFLASSGSARLPPAHVAEPLSAALSQLSEELLLRRPYSQRLNALTTQVGSVADAPRPQQRLAWLAGLRLAGASVFDSWAVVDAALHEGTEAARRAALTVREQFGVIHGSCQATLLFGAVAPDVTQNDVGRLAQLLLAQYAPGSESSTLSGLSRPRPVPPMTPPWQDGLELAEEFREALEIPDVEPVDLARILDHLDIELRHLELDDDSIRGVALASVDHRPTIVVNDNSPFAGSREATRFTIAHELCHFLVDRGLEGRQLAVASGHWAPRAIEQRANAFAAYLLMPPRGLWAHTLELGHPVSTAAGIEQLANVYQVSAHALIEHLPNVGLLTYTSRDRLLNARRQ